ncbi:MAG: hypothetical protein JWR24_428 [Actinoallomurus sp.]|jgi:hypothetical protein|nr:hypothetical protein [Actinoallomurus sp.]
MFSLFAVGCPICNEPVVAAIGVSGAPNYFAPVQPFLAAGAVSLLGHRAVPAVACDAVPRPDGSARVTGATASSVWEEYA